MEYFISYYQSDKNFRLFFAHIQEEELDEVYAFIYRAATRWLSLFRCLDRYLKLRDAILLRKQLIEDAPETVARDIFKEVIAPLETMALQLQRHDVPTASRISGLVSAAKLLWTEKENSWDEGACVRELASAAMKAWELRFAKYVILDSPTMMAAFVDPSQRRAIQDMNLFDSDHVIVWN